MSHMKTDIRLLVLTGVFCAGGAAYFRGDDKAFQLWSNLSTLTVGAAIGILKEQYDDKHHKDRAENSDPYRSDPDYR